MGVIRAMVADSGSWEQRLGKGAMFPSTSGKAGDVRHTGNPTERISSAGCWRHDIVPGRRESAQSLKPVKQSTHQPLLTEASLVPQAELGVVRPRVCLLGGIKPGSQKMAHSSGWEQGL